MILWFLKQEKERNLSIASNKIAFTQLQEKGPATKLYLFVLLQYFEFLLVIVRSNIDQTLWSK